MLSVASISVRKAEPPDYLALIGIDQYASSHFDRRASINEALAKGECFTAESDGELRGYVVLNYTFFGFGFIPLIVVAQSHRRRGIGMRLLCEARAQCTSRKLFTSANASNVAAQSLFRRAGFVRSGVIENLDAEDAEIVYFVEIDRT